MQPTVIGPLGTRVAIGLICATAMAACATTHRIYVRAAPKALSTGVVYSLPRALLRISVAGGDASPRLDTVLVPDPNARFALFIDSLDSSDWLEAGQSIALDGNGTLRAINGRTRASAAGLPASDLASTRSILLDTDRCTAAVGRDCVLDFVLGAKRLRIRIAWNDSERDRHSSATLLPGSAAREGFVYRVPALVPVTMYELDDDDRETALVSEVLSLPQFGSFALATVRWKAGSDPILSATLGADGSLQEYRVTANTYIDKALGKGFGGLDQLVDVVRQLRDVFDAGGSGAAAGRSPVRGATNQ